MSVQAKTYLDLAGLTSYNGKIKDWANSANQVAYKTVIKSTDGNSLYFYKKANAVEGTDTPDKTIALGGGDSSAKFTELANKIGATWSGNTLNLTAFADGISATTIVGAINEVWTDINTFIGEIPNGATATTVVGYAAEVAAAEADAAETAAKNYTDAEIAKLDADLDASGTAQHGGTFVVSGVTEVDGKITAVDSVEVETAGAAAAAVDALDVNEFALASESAGVVTIKGIKEVDGKIAIGDGAGISLGTAAKADKATTAIAEGSTDTSLVSAEQVATFVATEIADLEGAMHFVGVITRQTGETDAQAIARVVTNPESGDVVVMSDNAKEYIYDGTAWREVGDEGLYVKKSTTIAGVDLQDDITQSELQTALGLGSAAYENTSAFDAAGTAANLIASLDATESQTAGNDGLALSITEENGVITSISGSIEANTYDPYGAAARAVADLDTTDNVPIATYNSTNDTITITGAIAEADGIVSDVDTDNITLSTITTAQINALFA